MKKSALSKVTAEYEIIEPGTKVYVSLGYLTVKAGKVVGRRITEILDPGGKMIPNIEYAIVWFGAGDRKVDMEFFSERYVHLTPEDAFK